ETVVLVDVRRDRRHVLLDHLAHLIAQQQVMLLEMIVVHRARLRWALGQGNLRGSTPVVSTARRSVNSSSGSGDGVRWGVADAARSKPVESRTSSSVTPSCM